MTIMGEMRLYDERNQRLYINSDERQRFIKAAERADEFARTLCFTLLYTGCRISEALELTAASVQLDGRLISLRSLKKRGRVVFREVPVPGHLTQMLELAHSIRDKQRCWTQAKNAFYGRTMVLPCTG